jgi:hydroxyacylglutathione hydrolase
MARCWAGHGRLSDTPQDDVRIAIQRSHTLLSDTVRDLNKLDDG